MTNCKKSILGLLVLIMLWAGCQEKSVPMEELDLLSYGVPVKIKAPANTKVKYSNIGIIQDLTLSDSNQFYVQVFGTESETTKIEKAVSDTKTQVEESKYFSKMISEDPQGFIFEKKIDDDYINYDFRHIKIQGDKKYTFQAGLGKKYTLEDVKIMYKAVQ